MRACRHWMHTFCTHHLQRPGWLTQCRSSHSPDLQSVAVRQRMLMRVLIMNVFFMRLHVAARARPHLLSMPEGSGINTLPIFSTTTTTCCVPDPWPDRRNMVWMSDPCDLRACSGDGSRVLSTTEQLVAAKATTIHSCEQPERMYTPAIHRDFDV